MRSPVPAIALTALLFTASASARAEWLMVGAPEFRPRPGSEDLWRLSSYVWAEGQGQAGFFVPIKLPAGSTVTSMHCHLADFSGDFAPELSLHGRSQTDNGGTQATWVMAQVSTWGAPGHSRTADWSIFRPVIRNWTPGDELGAPFTFYSYVLSLGIDAACGSQCRVYNCMIEYTPPLRY